MFPTNQDPADIFGETDFHSGDFHSRSLFFPNQACLWGSYSKERISVRVVREGGSPVTLGPVPPKILVPGSWYQDLGTRILVPRSWYRDLGTKIFGGTSLVRWRDPPGGEGSLRDGPREDKRCEGSLTGYFANESSEIVLVRTNAENRSPTTHSGPP